MEGKRQRKDGDDPDQPPQHGSTKAKKRRLLMGLSNKKPTTTASAAGPSQTHVPSQASSSSMAAPATQAHQGQTQASSQAFSQGTQQLSQNQGSDISRELPTGQGALRYEAELSPARADRPNPQNRLFHEWKKHKAKAKVPDALATFTLPTKSFTQGVVAEAQDEIDAMMKKEGLSPKTAANWLISKLRSMKTPSKKAVEARAKARHALEKLAKEFIEPIKKETEASASSPSAVPWYFTYGGLYRILCTEVGDKNPDKHSDNISNAIMAELPQDTHVQFTTGYTLKTSCRQLLTNFSNMWTPAKCRADLRRPDVINRFSQVLFNRQKVARESHTQEEAHAQTPATAPQTHDEEVIEEKENIEVFQEDDKQKSIPSGSLEICAKLVNGLKTLVPKTDAPFQALQWFPIRQLRNAVVNFAGNKTKLNELAMKPDKEATTWDYDAIRFLGSGGSSKAQEQPQQSVSTELGTATDKDKELADTLANQLKATKAELASISKKLKVLEAQRRQAARLSRAHEKEHQSINPELYGRLKDIRDQCNALYLDQQRLHHSKSQDQSHLYMLNKKIRGQAVVAPKPVPAPPSFGPKTKIQGADPGLVTMASGICSDQKMLFESINRYEALQDSQETVHHGMDQDVPFQMTANVVNAAVSTKTSPTNSSKKKQEKRVKSKCRLRRFYGKHCSQHRKEMGSKSFVTFTGSWHGVSTYIRVALGGPPSHTAADLQLMVKAKSSPRTSLL
ncbi:hypothetical protein FB192DRAFT_1340469 [Mucor lusitanicus]|uniref:Uncharacterized protein n=1 Tax=Mucor circinelloides f. lusitanicus TaxID=29924 RepID=A0A8H4F5T2_MUCCL|nr:hypothetical protein FB192DRAFT_1340469 [Mucor lusitanicus]